MNREDTNYYTADVFKELFEQYNKDKMIKRVLHMIYVSLISSDSMFSIEDCDKCKENLLFMRDGLKAANGMTAKDFKFWSENIEKGLKICEVEKERLQFEAVPVMCEEDIDKIENEKM